jgi:glycerol uptake facilitator-like aquaporin
MKRYAAELVGTFWLVLGGVPGAAAYRFIGSDRS